MMEKRHQDSLSNRLEEVALNGCAHVTLEELYRWYDVQKIAARTYRDLEIRWQELSEGKRGRLMRVAGRGGVFLFGELTAEKVDQSALVDKL